MGIKNIYIGTKNAFAQLRRPWKGILKIGVSRLQTQYYRQGTTKYMYIVQDIQTYMYKYLMYVDAFNACFVFSQLKLVDSCGNLEKSALILSRNSMRCGRFHGIICPETMFIYMY